MNTYDVKYRGGGGEVNSYKKVRTCTVFGIAL